MTAEALWTGLGLLMAAILAGAMLGYFFAYNPMMLGQPAQVWVPVHCALQRISRRSFPILMIATGLALTPWALTVDDGRAGAVVGIAGAMVALVVTLAVDLPVHRRLDAAGDDVPHDWAALRLRWTVAHALRTLAAFVGLVAVIVAVVP